MPNRNLDEYIRSSFNKGGIDVNPKYSPATEGRFGRIWDRVRSELGNLTGTPAFNQNPATVGYRMLKNVPDYYNKAVEAGDWLGNVQKKGLGYLGRGTEAYGDFMGNQDFSKYGKMLGDWGLPGQENPPTAGPMPNAMTPDYKPPRPARDIAAMGGTGLTPDYKPQRPARPLTSEENAAPPVRAERTTGGTTTFAPVPSHPAGYKGNQRYLEMARASETDIDAQFEKMGGIEAIRGTNKTYWSPASGDEYLTKREAVAGRQGVLGPKDAAKTEQEQLDREAEMKKAGILSKTATDTANIHAKASTDTANIHGKASIEASHIAADKGRFSFEQATTDMDGKPNDDAVVFDTKTGISYNRNQMSPESVAHVLSSALETKDSKGSVQYFLSLSDTAQEKALAFLPEKQKAVLLDILRSMYGK
ncbi:MAG: hypothetical protein MIO92_03940 [Methanosarcinaceae archaeon]|nr:hypothetical protein [Methanosarcinaceae archaeon]